MSSLLVRGARQLLTLRGSAEPRYGSRMMDLGVVPDGSILINGHCISEVGTTRRVANLASSQQIECIDATGCIVMPGFVDPAADLLGVRPTLAALTRRAERLIHHGVTSVGALSRHRIPAHSEEALAHVGLDVVWDAGWESEHWESVVYMPMRFARRQQAVPAARDAIGQGKLVALSTGFQEPDTTSCSMLACIALAYLDGEWEVEQAITAATTNAAHLMGIGLQAGNIEPGRRADLILVEVPDYTDIPKHLGENLVRAVIKNGRIIHERHGSRWYSAL